MLPKNKPIGIGEAFFQYEIIIPKNFTKQKRLFLIFLTCRRLSFEAVDGV
jgi:hypothetical protein